MSTPYPPPPYRIEMDAFAEPMPIRQQQQVQQQFAMPQPSYQPYGNAYPMQPQHVHLPHGVMQTNVVSPGYPMLQQNSHQPPAPRGTHNFLLQIAVDASGVAQQRFESTYPPELSSFIAPSVFATRFEELNRTYGNHMQSMRKQGKMAVALFVLLFVVFGALMVSNIISSTSAFDSEADYSACEDEWDFECRRIADEKHMDEMQQGQIMSFVPFLVCMVVSVVCVIVVAARIQAKTLEADLVKLLSSYTTADQNRLKWSLLMREVPLNPGATTARARKHIRQEPYIQVTIHQ